MKRMIQRTALLGVFFCAGLIFTGNGQGFSPVTTARLQYVLDSFQNNPANPFVGGISAAINVDGLATWEGATGFAARNVDAVNNLLPGGTPFTIPALSRMFSVTKTFTAALVIELSGKGYFSLDAPVSNFLPLSLINPALDGTVTIRQLLGHQSGYSDYTDEYMLQVSVAFQPSREWTAYEAISFVHQINSPGAERRYSSTNYIMLGAIVEAVTGKPMEQHYREQFFIPLHYTSMFLGEREAVNGHGELVAPHDNLSVFNPIFSMTGQPVFPDSWTNISRFPMNAVVSLAYTGGGLVSNVTELARWGTDLFGGRAVSPATLRTMLQSVPSTPDEDGDYLGYGIWTNHRISATDYFIGHNGSSIGYKALMMYQPDRKMSIAIMSNFYGSDPYIIARKLYESLPQFLCGNGNQPDHKILVCFKGKDLCVARQAAAQHIRKGAYLGSCQGTVPTLNNVGKGESVFMTDDNSFSVFPNPSGGEVTIRFRSPVDGMVKLELYDLQGRLLQPLYSGNLQKGMYKQVKISAEGLVQGMYICRLQTTGGIVQRKLIIHR